MQIKDVGDNAGAIWHLLLEQGMLSIKQIEEYTGYKEKVIILSLGWLARENKINFVEKNDNIHIELKHSGWETYY